MVGRTFTINDRLLEALDEYHERTMLMEKHVIERVPHDNLKKAVNDDLIFNVPIYDMGHRKYAAFCSLTEALWKGDEDVKGNGQFFKNHGIKRDIDWLMLFYLFRLCGSGINYKPKTSDSPFGTHGFGNFWVVNCIKHGLYTWEEWIEELDNIDRPFTDNRGYLLPQFSIGLKNFIKKEAFALVVSLKNFMERGPVEIFEVTDHGNVLLKLKGYKRQNFVLTAFAADVAEYFPNLVLPHSRTYAGTQATKCIKLIFRKKNRRTSSFDYINDVLEFQADRYGLNPIDCEDSRNCDVIRYFKEYQSPHHVESNKGVKHLNNSILKKRISEYWYYESFLKEI